MTTWRGTLRSMAAAARRAERDSQRRHRELIKRQTQVAKLEALQQAALEVEVFENHLNVLQSVHKECSDDWDWEAVRATDRPVEPVRSSTREKAAEDALSHFSASFIDRLFRRADRKMAELALAVEHGRRADENAFQTAMTQYKIDMSDWERMQKIADGVIEGRADSYIDAIRETAPFGDISELGLSLEFHGSDSWYLEVVVHANGDEIVPTETKSLLQSGKLSSKKMSKTQYFEIYQDHICSCTLRVAREVFALLPIEMVFVHVATEMVNSSTGRKVETPILSVAIPRTTLAELNLDTIDCSDSMRNFVHRMAFNRTKGFSAIERLRASDFSHRETEHSQG